MLVIKEQRKNFTTNYVSLVGYYFQDSFARKNSSSGFFITDYAIAMAQRSLFDFGVSKNKQTAKPTGQT